jgi:GWxTD domain-containing protein
LFLVPIMLAFAACHHVTPISGPQPEAVGQGRADSLIVVPDPKASYRRAGLLVSSGAVSFVGSIGFLAGAVPESTLVLIDLSLSDHALTFTREGEAYHAAYDVVLEFERAGAPIHRVMTHEQVRVGSFRETTRDEESVIFQQMAVLPPGDATIAVSIRDAGSTHAGVVRRAVTVPRFDEGTIATPIPALRARPRTSRERLPEIVVNPRATAVYGRDSVALFYVEGYGPSSLDASQTVQVRVAGDSGVLVYQDTVPWIETGNRLRSAILKVPLSRVGFGELSISVDAMHDGDVARPRPNRAPLLVSFGEGLPVSSFGEMVELLRFFASSDRLRALHELPPSDRAKGWTAFLEATDPVTSSPENEALRAYFARLADANVRFREDDRTPGWQTDRGMIFSAFGEPDNMIEPNGSDSADRSIVQVWEYRRYRTRFTFVDQGGSGHWHLTSHSEADYRALMLRLER